jgi:ornithine lipid ester-linked acyl 2-hydroxylase
MASIHTSAPDQIVKYRWLNLIKSLLYRMSSWSGQRLIWLVEVTFSRFSSEIIEKPPWSWDLILHASSIRAEFEALANHELKEFGSISPEQRRISDGNSWKVYVLRAYGRQLRQTAGRCPVTTRITSGYPDITTVLFSVLEPNTYIKAHRGPYGGVLRCHIPLKIPDGDCAIRVGDQLMHWQLGEPLFFDDTLEHEAWNRTSERRVVLFIDYLKPLPWPLSRLNEAMIWLIGRSPFVNRAIQASL